MVKSNMPETISMVPKSYEKSAILGGAGNPEKKTSIANKIDVVANQVNEILKIEPIDDLAKNKIYNKAGDLVDGLKIGASDVAEMDLVLKDASKTDKQKEIMTTNLEILAKGTFIAMQYGGNQEMVDLLGKGLVSEIDDALPKPLSGLGERILSNVFTNDKVLGVLKELDQKALEDGWKLMPPTREEKRTVLETYARNLARLDKDIPEGHEERDELVMALSYIQTELLDLREGANTLVEETEENDGQRGRIFDRTRYEVPNNPIEQLSDARICLENIERRGLDPFELEANDEKRILDKLRDSKEVDKMVKQEIITRIKLQKSVGLMSSTGGWLGLDTPRPIITVLDEIKKSTGLLDIDDLRFFFDNKKNGIAKTVSAAWDSLQEMNMGDVKRLPPLPDGKPGKILWGPYHETLLKMQQDKAFCRKMGIDPNNDAFFSAGMSKPDIVDKERMWEGAFDNYFLDANKKRKDAVNGFIAKEIRNKDKTITEEESLKGVELAWNLMVATAETSVFNAAFAGHNDLSELILTKYDTLDRMSESKGKTIGSLTCMERIVSMGTTWLRYLSDRTVFGPLKVEDVKKNLSRLDVTDKWGIEYCYGPMITQKISEAKKEMRDVEKKTAKDLYNNSAYLKDLGEKIGKVAKFPSVILDKEGKVIINTDGKIDEDTGQPKINKLTGEPIVDKVDAYGRPLVITSLEKETKERRIRFLMVAAWANQAVSNPELGWDESSWKSFKDILTRKYQFDEEDLSENNTKSFISNEDLNIIEKKILGKVLTKYADLYVVQRIREQRANNQVTALKPVQGSFHV